MSIDRLIKEHDGIDHAIGNMATAITSSTSDAVTATLALSDLAEQLRCHLAHEDSYIYAEAARDANSGFAKTAEQFITEFKELRADWDIYLREWTTDCMTVDWAGFQAETRSIIARLADRVKAENEVLYTAGLQHGVIPLIQPVNQIAA